MYFVVNHPLGLVEFVSPFRPFFRPAAFVRLINALARPSRETMLVQKYRDACARARAALQNLKDPKRKLTESERRAILLHVDTSHCDIAWAGALASEANSLRQFSAAGAVA